MARRISGIWDVHCHLTGVPGRTPHERMAGLIAVADRVGVERLCVFMGMQFDYDPAAGKLRQDNFEVTEAISHWHDRAFGFVYLNPRHLDYSLELLDEHVGEGPMVGVKLWVAQRCDSPEVDAIIRRAAELHAPVLQHTWLKITGNLPGESTPQDLANLAARHPDATIICGHTGGDWEYGIRAVRPFENVYVDLGGGDPAAGLTEMAVRELGAERVLFGSDIGGRSYGSQLAKVYGANIKESDRELILRGNLQRILTPILESKGIQP